MFDMWQRQRRNANKRDPLKDRQYYAWYRGAGTVLYLRFNEAACLFTRRVSSGLKICSLALPLRCLCVIITTCSPLFLLSYIYIPFFLSFFPFPFLFLFLRSRLRQIAAFAFSFWSGVSAPSKWSGLRQTEVFPRSEVASGWQGAVA